SAASFSYNLLQTTLTNIQRTTEYFLTDISWRGGKIVFSNINDRQDRTGEKRLQEISVYASDINETFTKIKDAKLNHSYFYYNSTLGLSNPYSNTDKRNYRLRLDEVKFLPINPSDQSQSYAMAYNNSPMTSRESTGQDDWGFNNGKFLNSSMFSQVTVQDHLGTNYTIGSADRKTDTAAIKACSLQSIQYPTGGKTVFEMEPHVSSGLITYNPGSTSCGVLGNSSGPTFISQPFTVPVNAINVRYTIQIGAYNVNPGISPPVIIIKDETTGQQISINNPNPSTSYNSGILYSGIGTNINFNKSHTYTLSANAYTNTGPSNGTVLVNLAINWDNPNLSLAYGGGLRVKSITNYNPGGSFASKDLFKYGFDENGGGDLITPAGFLNLRSNTYTQRIGCPSLGFVQYYYAPTSYVYYANTVAAASQVSGSPILYSYITKYQTSAAGADNFNGKTVYHYNLFYDETIANTTDPRNMVYSNTWKNNLLANESSYQFDGTLFKLIQEKQYNYSVARTAYRQFVRVKKIYVHLGPEYQDAAHVNSDFTFDSYKMATGLMQLDSVVTIKYDRAGLAVADREINEYTNSAHLLPTSKITMTSKGDKLIVKFKYPHDFSAIQPYTEMVNRHIWSPVIEKISYKNTDTSVPLESTMTDYFLWTGSNNAILPQKISTKLGNNVYDPRIQYLNYDKNANLLSLSRLNDIKINYVWSYNSRCPIAEIKGADYGTIESLLGGSTAVATFSSLPNPDKTAVDNFLLPLKNNLPQAFISSFLYQPLVGTTSETDVKGQTTYYDYDSFQRLKSIKDRNGDVVKSITYHYKP
ncbi:hypothetical protein DBR11_00070, partial [Pedobacter sp. HMWF019]|uniref:hypothetical protein n=1 Tax=Pedobacter sp. HMWF019 TaxID=2056856 RepID=UPI000D48997D